MPRIKGKGVLTTYQERIDAIHQWKSGLPLEEIAKFYNVSEQSVKFWISKEYAMKMALLSDPSLLRKKRKPRRKKIIIETASESAKDCGYRANVPILEKLSAMEKYWDGVPAEEIARACNVSIATVESWVQATNMSGMRKVREGNMQNHQSLADSSNMGWDHQYHVVTSSEATSANINEEVQMDYSQLTNGETTCVTAEEINSQQQPEVCQVKHEVCDISLDSCPDYSETVEIDSSNIVTDGDKGIRENDDEFPIKIESVSSWNYSQDQKIINLEEGRKFNDRIVKYVMVKPPRRLSFKPTKIKLKVLKMLEENVPVKDIYKNFKINRRVIDYWISNKRILNRSELNEQKCVGEQGNVVSNLSVSESETPKIEQHGTEESRASEEQKGSLSDPANVKHPSIESEQQRSIDKTTLERDIVEVIEIDDEADSNCTATKLVTGTGSLQKHLGSKDGMTTEKCFEVIDLEDNCEEEVSSSSTVASNQKSQIYDQFMDKICELTAVWYFSKEICNEHVTKKMIFSKASDLFKALNKNADYHFLPNTQWVDLLESKILKTSEYYLNNKM